MHQSDPTREIENFFSQYKISTYKKRQLLLRATDTQSVFYIQSGFVRVYRISENGEELTLAILKPKDFFPLTYGINQTSNQYYLEALTPLTLIKVPQDKFLTFIKSSPDVFYELTHRLLVLFDGAMSRIEYLVFSNAYTKVAAALVMCAKRFGEMTGKSIRIPLPLTHHDIATFVGITRETTSHEMKKLEKRGFIAKEGRHIIIKQMYALENLLLPHTQLSNALIYPL